MDYRAYLLDDNGKIFRGEDIEASDDANAIAIGWDLFDGHNENPMTPTPAHGIEIWYGRKLVFNQMR